LGNWRGEGVDWDIFKTAVINTFEPKSIDIFLKYSLEVDIGKLNSIRR